MEIKIDSESIIKETAKLKQQGYIFRAVVLMVLMEHPELWDAFMKGWSFPPTITGLEEV